MTDGKGSGTAGYSDGSAGGGDVPAKNQEHRYQEPGKESLKPDLEPAASPFDQPFDEPKPLNDKVPVEDKETDESMKPSTEYDYNPEASYGSSIQYEKMDPLSSGFPHGSSVEVADVSEKNNSGIEVSKDSSSFLDMMEEAGITKKHIFMVVGVFAFVVGVILFFALGGYKLFMSDGTKPAKVSEEVKIEEEVKPEVPEVKFEEAKPEAKEPALKDTAVPPSFDQVFGLSGLVNSYIFGLEFSKYKILQGLNVSPVSEGGSMVGVEASLAVGKSAEVNKNNIIYYTDLLRRIDEARKINLYDYLNKFVDRRKALQDHLGELNQLVLEADADRNAILQELERLNTEYGAVSVQKDIFEKGFFESMNSYHGEGSYDNLELFIEASQRQIKGKAYYNTLKTLSGMLSSAISALSPRIQDISVNAEALIKGVRVFEVHGSNIDAIIIQNGIK